jgi:hypothetical protein
MPGPRPLPGRGAKAAFDAAAQRIDSSIERAACSSVAGKGVHSSSAIVTVASRLCWMAIERAGVRRWRLPSRCDWKVTPSASMVRSLASDIT